MEIQQSVHSSEKLQVLHLAFRWILVLNVFPSQLPVHESDEFIVFFLYYQTITLVRFRFSILASCFQFFFGFFAYPRQTALMFFITLPQSFSAFWRRWFASFSARACRLVTSSSVSSRARFRSRSYSSSRSLSLFWALPSLYSVSSNFSDCSQVAFFDFPLLLFHVLA